MARKGHLCGEKDFLKAPDQPLADACRRLPPVAAAYFSMCLFFLERMSLRTGPAGQDQELRGKRGSLRTATMHTAIVGVLAHGHYYTDGHGQHAHGWGARLPAVARNEPRVRGGRFARGFEAGFAKWWDSVPDDAGQIPPNP
ncbi:MAG: hypothetical protein JWR26_808 [Pedosphaera sp.]|nr:hypothetical protein [Pedosphaera sp.]